MTLSLAPLFNEKNYPPLVACQKEYAMRVQSGYARMGQRRVVIAGLARNVESYLPWTIARIETLGKCFADYRVLIYENDSNDQTPTLLQQWTEQNHRVHLCSESLGDPIHRPERCLHRAERMALYRRRCQENVRERWPDYDDVIIVDTDLVGGWSFDGIANTFGYDNWDFVGANGIIYKRLGLKPNVAAHYDAWAYRDQSDFTLASTKYVNRLQFHRGEPLYRLYSCFGGLGVYTMEAYLRGTYTGGDVEHASFHKSLIQQGIDRIYLNPSQIVVYGRKARRMDPWIARLHSGLDKLPLVTAPVWLFPGSRLTGILSYQPIEPNAFEQTTVARKAG